MCTSHHTNPYLPGRDFHRYIVGRISHLSMVIPVSSKGSTGGLYGALTYKVTAFDASWITFGWLSMSHKFYNEVRGTLKGVGRESVMPQWTQIYGTWFLQVCSRGLVGEVGALITINLRIVQVTQYFSYTVPHQLWFQFQTIEGCHGHPGLDPTFRAGARDFQNYFREGLLGA